MKEHPRIMCPAMVQAILDGRKRMTRRLDGLEQINESPNSHFYRGANSDGDHLFCDEDAIMAGHDPQTCMTIIPASCRLGDRIWVKETHWRYGRWVKDGQTGSGRDRWRFRPIKCSDEFRFSPQPKLPREQEGYHKRPSIFMPKAAARIILGVTAEERCERLQDISEADAHAEGVRFCVACGGTGAIEVNGIDTGCPVCKQHPCRYMFARLWDELHGEGAWEKNPWVRVIQFRRIET